MPKHRPRIDGDDEYRRYIRLWQLYLERYQEKTFRDRFSEHLRFKYRVLPDVWPNVSVALGGKHPEDRRRFIRAMEVTLA